jgi:hypothetical protein
MLCNSHPQSSPNIKVTRLQACDLVRFSGYPPEYNLCITSVLDEYHVGINREGGVVNGAIVDEGLAFG